MSIIKSRKLPTLITLMIVGETIFFLPFVVTRVFRPTFLTVFDIDNLELGTAFSVYGIVAMASYFLGGPIADRFSPKKLLIYSLSATALAGLIMAGIPSLTTLTLLYGFWGLSTILLFWAAYIKGIRQFGGEESQGKSQGLVDGGRGLVAALIASASVFLLDAFLPVSAEQANYHQLENALSLIIILISGFVLFTTLLVWKILPKDLPTQQGRAPKINLGGVRKAISQRSVWLQAIILLCAYVGYKCTDDFGLYAQDAFGYDDVASAHIATTSFWMRPIAAVVAGFLGDRFVHSKITSVCFVILIVGSLVISSGILPGDIFILLALTLASTSLGIYGLRGLYYALFQESRIPLSYAGAAIGFISVIGYTPDVFMGPLMGVLLDNNPGELGHQYVFGVLVGFGVVGLGASILFAKTNRFQNNPTKSNKTFLVFKQKFAMPKNQCLFIFILILLTACGGNDSPDVIKTKSGLYGSKHGEFLIQFPNKPQSGVSKNIIADKEINMYSLTYNQGVEHRYRVDYVDYPPEILSAWDVEQLFDQIVNTVVVNMESFSIRERTVETNSYDKSIKYNLRSSVYDVANGVIRILKSGNRIYIISFWATRNVPNNEDFDSFVQSFAIYKPKVNS